jgi:stearoyl-CoA desaturase (delta-9 desaturase)
MPDDQSVGRWSVVELHGKMPLDFAGGEVAVDSGGRQAMKSAMTRQGVPEVPETHPASRLYRVFTGLFVFGPPTLLVAAFRSKWLSATRTNRRIFGVFYILSGLGITAGYHRLFTHRSFKTHPLIRGIFAVLGSTAIQGSVPDWVADHRKHHAYADEEGDPHSPHMGHKGGRIRGFVHAHFGWLFADEKASRQRYVPDLLDDPVVMAVHRRFALIVALSYFVAPVTAGLIATGKLRGGLSAFLWGGALRVFFVHHATWSVNSVCHLWGTRPFETRDESRNNPLVALVGLGEGNHHNHHAFPRSARHGLQRWQLDPTWWLIWTMEKTGLAWDVQRVSLEEMEVKRVAERAPGRASALTLPHW